MLICVIVCPQTSDVMLFHRRGHVCLVLPHDAIQGGATSRSRQRPLRPVKGERKMKRNFFDLK